MLLESGVDDCSCLRGCETGATRGFFLRRCRFFGLGAAVSEVGEVCGFNAGVLLEEMVELEGLSEATCMEVSL